MNINKTDIFSQRKKQGFLFTFTVSKEELKQVNSFTYIGIIITESQNIDEEI